MSMFDELTCEAPLPDVGVVDWTFQTKSLDCMMDLYRITAAGRLLHIGNGFFDERPPFEIPVDMNYHGDLTFTYWRNGKSCEYVARFTNGLLIREGIRRVEMEHEK